MAIKFDNSLVNRVQQATDIVDVISEHLSLDRKGREFVGLCPFHSDNRPSLYVNPVKQIFKCFACGAGGDAFKFIQLRESLTFPQAVERLAQRAGIEVKHVNRRNTGGKSSADSDDDPKLIAKINDWTCRYFQKSLYDEQKGLKARRYLEDRQINDESVKSWAVGLAIESWDDLMSAGKSAGISEGNLLKAGVVVSREGGGCYDKFRDRLMFPIVDVTGRVIGFGGRTLGDDSAKYVNSPATVLFDKSNCLYGLDKARHKIVSCGTVVVVEGYTDVIMAHQFGCSNVVATLGTSFTAGHAKILRRYAKRIVLVFDSDVAGMEAANRALEVCLAGQIDIKLAFAPDGKDPCDYLLTAGSEGFEEVVGGAVDVMDFKWRRLVEGMAGSDNIADKRAATEEFLRTVATAVKSGRLDPIARGMVVTKLSSIIGISNEQVNRELAKLAGRLNRSASYAVKNQKVVSFNLGDGIFAKAQREVLEVLLNEPGLFENVPGAITVEAFDVPILRQIAERVFDWAESGDKKNLTELLAKVESVEGSSAIVRLAELGQKKGSYRERLTEAAGVFENHIEDIKKNEIKVDLSDDDTESLRRISGILGKRNKRNPGMITN